MVGLFALETGMNLFRICLYGGRESFHTEDTPFECYADAEVYAREEAKISGASLYAVVDLTNLGNDVDKVPKFGYDSHIDNKHRSARHGK
jgi:hypothetical protein